MSHKALTVTTQNSFATLSNPLKTLHRRAARSPQLSVRSQLTAAKPDTTKLGNSGIEVSSIGVGAWSWGDRSGYWGYGGEYGADENRTAYEATLDAGITFLDTAEVYGFGKSEELIADFKRGSQRPKPAIATKFAPLPWRFTSDSVVSALQASLRRLEQDKVELYMIHWPGFLTNAFSNDAYVRGLAKCKQAGLTEAVGVSNFKAKRVRSAHKILQDAGIPLASNQVQYSLLYRAPERNGVMDACRELGVTLVAYSPLCQGLLTGKYQQGFKPSGPRKATFNDGRIAKIQPLIGLLREIGEQQGGKTPAQVAINWTICKGALPIPGAKNSRQVADIAGALGWRLSPDEVSALDRASDRIEMGVGAPFENW